MDLQPQASFIPKKPLTASPVSGTGSTSIIWIVAVFIFVCSCIAAAAVFAYTVYLNHQIMVAKNSLDRARAAYDPASIEDLIRLSSRMTQAKTLLSVHVAPSAIFSFLEQNTLSTVRFTEFSYSSNADHSVSLKLTGNAADFASVALQSDQFGAATHILKNVVFSGINIDPSSGIVKFDISANLNPDVILYSNQLNTQPAAVPTPLPASSAASSTAPIPPQ